MNTMIKKLTALAALASCLTLAGCAAATTPAPHHGYSTVAPATPAPTATTDAMPAASGIVDTVWIDVYPSSTFAAKHGCHCTLPGSTQELFPVGTPVVLIKVTLTGKWTPAQGNSTSQDITGISLSGTKFDGRPEPAEPATADGPAAAAHAGLPWMPEGLFTSGENWSITNEKSTSFATAWYLPAGVDRLLLKVYIPAEGQANDLTVPLPAAVLRAASGEGE
ncbi:hypothetical protein [Leifsonia aquatica]|uniref:hypothetical protein n=1 Tax=Leifsonia aquatica TaxID=144185 RepID=UPI0028AF5175|nr:hypothetical protein [Leifsonia aquatica]